MIISHLFSLFSLSPLSSLLASSSLSWIPDFLLHFWSKLRFIFFSILLLLLLLVPPPLPFLSNPPPPPILLLLLLDLASSRETASTTPGVRRMGVASGVQRTGVASRSTVMEVSGVDLKIWIWAPLFSPMAWDVVLGLHHCNAARGLRGLTLDFTTLSLSLSLFPPLLKLIPELGLASKFWVWHPLVLVKLLIP